MKRLILTCLLVLASGMAVAAIESYSFETTQQEDDYKDLIAELRCLVCQNQNLADSDAELAQDLRKQVYEMITEQGAGKNEIVDYMVQRYGDFVLYRPPVKGNTLLLWAGPMILLVGGMFVAIRIIRATGKAPQPEVDSADLSEVKKILESEEKDK